MSPTFNFYDTGTLIRPVCWMGTYRVGVYPQEKVSSQSREGHLPSGIGTYCRLSVLGGVDLRIIVSKI